MEQVQWPEGKKSAAMFSFDLDGDVIWRNMTSDEPNTEKLYGHVQSDSMARTGAWDMILDLLDKYGVKATFYVPDL